MKSRHNRAPKNIDNSKDSEIKSRKRYAGGALAAVAMGSGVVLGLGLDNERQEYKHEAAAIEVPAAAEAYGISAEIETELMKIQARWSRDAKPLGPDELPASILRESGMVNFEIIDGAGGAAQQAKEAYANLYNLDVDELSPKIKDSIDITAESFPRVHGGQELSVLEVTRLDNADEKLAIVTDRVELDTE